MMARVRIVSDGTSENTHVYIDGSEILDVTRVDWWIDAGDVGCARLEFVYVEVDVVGEQVES